MALVSLDSPTFFCPPSSAGGNPTSYSRLPRNAGPPVVSLEGAEMSWRDTNSNLGSFPQPPRVDVVLLSSDSESDDGELDESRSNTFPPVDALLPLAKSGTVTDSSKNPVSGSEGVAKEPSATGIVNPDTQKPELPVRVAVQDGSNDPSLAYLPSLEVASSPAPLQTDLSPKNSSGTSPTLRSNDTIDSRSISTPRPSPGEDADNLHNLHFSRLQRDAGPLETSHGENSQPRENLGSHRPRVALHTSDAAEPRRGVSPGQCATAQSQTPRTLTILEGLLVPPDAQQTQRDPPSPADIASGEVEEMPADITDGISTVEVVDAVSPDTVPTSLDISYQPLNNSCLPQNIRGRVVVNISDDTATLNRAEPTLEARDEIHPVGVQRPPKGIEIGQGRGEPEPEPVQVPGGQHSSIERQPRQLRQSQRKTMPHHRITDSTDKEDPQILLGRRRRRRRQSNIEAKSINMYQPSEGSEGEQDNSSNNFPLPARKCPRTAAGEQARHVHTSHLARKTPKHHGIITPPVSQDSDSSDTHTCQAPAATFQEWPLPNAVLKRAVINGIATFQLQFTWETCDNRDHKADTVRGQRSHLPTEKQIGRRTAWTSEEENLIVELKKQGFEWNTIYQRFKEVFPETNRHVGNLQVRYCTKLKNR